MTKHMSTRSKREQMHTNAHVYSHDVFEIYLKPVTSVPGATFAAPGADGIAFR